MTFTINLNSKKSIGLSNVSQLKSARALIWTRETLPSHCGCSCLGEGVRSPGGGEGEIVVVVVGDIHVAVFLEANKREQLSLLGGGTSMSSSHVGTGLNGVCGVNSVGV